MATINESKRNPVFPKIEYIDIQELHKGDLLILDFENGTRKTVTVEKVKVSESDGIEIIYDLKKNHYFNLTMYRAEKSNVLHIHRIK